MSALDTILCKVKGMWSPKSWKDAGSLVDDGGWSGRCCRPTLCGGRNGLRDACACCASCPRVRRRWRNLGDETRTTGTWDDSPNFQQLNHPLIDGISHDKPYMFDCFRVPPCMETSISSRNPTINLLKVGESIIFEVPESGMTLHTLDLHQRHSETLHISLPPKHITSEIT